MTEGLLHKLLKKFEANQDILDTINMAKEEYRIKCAPDFDCNCDECKWFKKYFGEFDAR